MSPTPSSRDDLILQRLDQLHAEIQGIREGLRDDLKAYELRELHDKDVENLKDRDEEQQKDINQQKQDIDTLRTLVFSKNEKAFQRGSAIIFLLASVLSVLHTYFHIF